MRELLALLDDPAFLRERDPDGMLETLLGLPEQCREALEHGARIPLPELPLSPAHVVFAGLGGSAVGGDLARLAAGKARLPVLVSRDYTLPPFVGPESLVVLVSYSGNTEETLSAYAEAGERGAARLAVTSGGRLAELAVEDGVPLVRVPGGLPPRSALGYLFLPVLVLLQRLGVFPGGGGLEEIPEVLASLREELGPGKEAKLNPAKELAARLYGKIPVVFGASGTTEPAALRWKTQFNENAKCPAYWNVFPELNHNEVVGFEAPEELLRALYLVFLRDEADHPRVKARQELTERLLAPRVGGSSRFQGRGRTLLGRVLGLIYLGDFASVYLAFLYGVNPKPVAVIDYLKQELARLGEAV